MARQQGAIKWFSNAKGYGFIGRNQGDDIFVHYSAIQMDGYKMLSEGDVVEFEVIQGEKGPQAADVTLIRPGNKNSKPIKKMRHESDSETDAR